MEITGISVYGPPKLISSQATQKIYTINTLYNNVLLFFDSKILQSIVTRLTKGGRSLSHVAVIVFFMRRQKLFYWLFLLEQMWKKVHTFRISRCPKCKSALWRNFWARRWEKNTYSYEKENFLTPENKVCRPWRVKRVVPQYSAEEKTST